MSTSSILLQTLQDYYEMARSSEYLRSLWQCYSIIILLDIIVFMLKIAVSFEIQCRGRLRLVLA